MKLFAFTGILITSACVPVPYLTPPAHVSIDVHPNPEFTGDVGDLEEPVSTNVAFGLAPMGAFSSMSKRRVDAYSGIMLHSSDSVGPFVALDYWPVLKTFGTRSTSSNAFVFLRV